MPLYEYQCQECDHRLEALQRLAEPPLTTCPDCGGELRKLFSAPAFQFKGSGWYVTDYARKNGDSKAKDKDKEAAPDKAGDKAEKKTAGSETPEKKKGKEPGKAAAGAGN